MGQRTFQITTFLNLNKLYILLQNTVEPYLSGLTGTGGVLENRKSG